jgi:hypothetical protein
VRRGRWLRSYAAIVEWVADAPETTVLALGIAPDRRPSEAMIRRLLQALDPQLLTTAIGVWLAERATAHRVWWSCTVSQGGKWSGARRTSDPYDRMPRRVSAAWHPVAHRGRTITRRRRRST